MKILYLSGITGKKGILSVKKYLKDRSYDIICAGVDNLSFYSRGISSADLDELMNIGVNVMCAGNYGYSHPTSHEVFSKYTHLIRAANLYEGAYGNSYIIYKDTIFIVFLGIENNVNVFGRSEFPFVRSPFTAFDELYEKYSKYNIFIDYHGGSFAEKRVFAEYVKNRAAAVIGSHYNVQTNDEKIIGTCAFISDAGFCGVLNSIGGLKIENYLDRYISRIPKPLPREDNSESTTVQGVEIEIENNKAISIRKIS